MPTTSMGASLVVSLPHFGGVGTSGICGSPFKPQHWPSSTWMVPVCPFEKSRPEKQFFAHSPQVFVLGFTSLPSPEDTRHLYSPYAPENRSQHGGNAETQRHNIPSSADRGADQPSHPDQVARPAISRLPAWRGLLGARGPSCSQSVLPFPFCLPHSRRPP